MKTKPLLVAATAAFLVTLLPAQTPLAQAGSAFKQGDLAGAEALLTPLTQDAAALHLLSQVQLAAKRNQEAVASAEAALKLDATQADYHAQLGVALSRRMGELSFMQQAMLAGRTRKAFEKAVELDPKNQAGLIGLCRYFANAPEIAGGSLEKAKQFANRLLEINPGVGESELGNIAEKDENFAEALQHYEKVAELRPTHGWSQYQCGRMLVKLDRKADARPRFEAALRFDPNLEAARKALAELGSAG